MNSDVMSILSFICMILSQVFLIFRFIEARNKCYHFSKRFDSLYRMRIKSKDVTVFLEAPRLCLLLRSYIHKAELLNPLAGARMRNPFSEKLG